MFKHTPHPTLRNRDGMAVIGRTHHDLRGIRYGEGEGGGTPAPAAPPATPPAAPPAPPATPTPPPAAPPAPVNYKGDPDEYVRELREEARTHRLAAEAATATAAEREKERDAATASRDELARTNKLILTAPKLGANADLLLDSSSFTKTFAAVDLNDQAAVNQAITDALEKNSAFRSGPALPASSGGGHQGGHPSATPISLDGAVKKHFGG